MIGSSGKPGGYAGTSGTGRRPSRSHSEAGFITRPSEASALTAPPLFPDPTRRLQISSAAPVIGGEAGVVRPSSAGTSSVVPPASLRPISAGSTRDTGTVSDSDSYARLFYSHGGDDSPLPARRGEETEWTNIRCCLRRVERVVGTSGRSGSSILGDEVDPEDEGLDEDKGALFKRKDFLGIEEEGGWVPAPAL